MGRGDRRVERIPQQIAQVEGPEAGASDVLVIGGGIIPEDDAATLRTAGVAAIFGPGTDTQEVVEFVRAAAAKRVGGRARS